MTKDLTFEDAIKLSSQLNKPIKHRYFTRDEYMYVDEFGGITFDDGIKYNTREYMKYRKDMGFEDGWTILDIDKDEENNV